MPSGNRIEASISVRAVADAFVGGTGTIPVNPLVSAAVGALLCAGPAANPHSLDGGWQADDNGQPLYRHLGKRAGEIRVHVDPHEAAEQGLQAWDVLAGVNPLTIDVLLTVLAQLCDARTRDRTKFPLGGSVALSASKIASYKNFSRWGADRADFLERIRAEVHRLQILRFDLIRFPAWDPMLGRWNGAGISLPNLRLFEAIEAPAAGANGDYVWLVRFGQWTQWWLNTQATVWTGPLPKAAVEFDHRKNRGTEVLAKKIAINALLLWCAIRARANIERRVESLLEDIGELPPIEERGAHWAGRMRDRFDEALMLLKEKGLVDDVTWSDRFSPGAYDRNKGWVEPWLASKVVLVRPSAVFGDGEAAEAAPAAERARPRRQRRTARAVSNSKTDLRQIRLKFGITQADLADALGVSPSYLSQVETGRIAISSRISGNATAYFARFDEE